MPGAATRKYVIMGMPGSRKTQPVLDLFRRKEYVVPVDATRTPAEVHDDIRARLRLPG